MQGKVLEKFLEWLAILLKKRRLIHTQVTKRLNLSLQSLYFFLILSESTSELKAPVKVAYPANQHSQHNRAKDDQEERDFWNLEPLIILQGIKTKSKSHLALVLYGEKDGKNKDDHPKKCLQPFHFGCPPF
jgi:hypothetical protein